MYQKSPESHQQILQVIFITISVYLSISMLVTSSTTLSTSRISTTISLSTTSMSIINYQSLVSKVLRRYLHSPGSHQSTRFLVTHCTDSLTQWLTSRASCDAKKGGSFNPIQAGGASKSCESFLMASISVKYNVGSGVCLDPSAPRV